MRVVGLMSGTSADGVDAALVEWPEGASARPFRLLHFREQPFPAALQERVHRLAAGELGGGGVLRELADLDVSLGERFAAAALALLREAGVPAEEVAGVASHGQTVAHHPDIRASLQLGDPSVIAERTGLPVVADFRARDLAAGGEGAPLAPFFHRAVLGDEAESRVFLNLGGIANLTWMPKGGRAEEVLAFDVGPANALLDGVVRALSGGRETRDRDGAGARRGRVSGALLEELLEDSYLRRPPPKSTGRERYGRAEADALAARARRGELAADDLLATLVAFTAEAFARACRDFLPGGAGAVGRVLLGGGGGRNPSVVEALRRALPRVPIEPSDAVGVPAQAVEAMAFSLLGRNALLGLPNHLPRCTGASRETVLGEIVPAGPRSRG